MGVSMRTEEYVVERALGVVREVGANHLARCFVDMPDKQVAALNAI